VSRDSLQLLAVHGTPTGFACPKDMFQDLLVRAVTTYCFLSIGHPYFSLLALSFSVDLNSEARPKQTTHDSSVMFGSVPPVAAAV
jgi:hypothetical protein